VVPIKHTATTEEEVNTSWLPVSNPSDIAERLLKNYTNTKNTFGLQARGIHAYCKRRCAREALV